MTLPTSGTLSLDAINTEFSLGRNLAAYRGIKWYKDDNSRGYFDNNSTGNGPPIDFSEFYGTRKTITVTVVNNQGQATGVYTVPFYNTLTFVLRTGTTGSTGGDGVNWYGGYNFGPVPGQAPTRGPYPTVLSWGGYSLQSADGVDNAQVTVVFNAEAGIVYYGGSNTGYPLPLRNTSITMTVGAGGPGGAGGAGNWSSGATGASGNPGSITLSVA